MLHLHFLTLPQRMRALAGRGTVAPAPASPNSGANTNSTMPDYSIYDLAAAMATARQVTTFINNAIARLVHSSALAHNGYLFVCLWKLQSIAMYVLRREARSWPWRGSPERRRRPRHRWRRRWGRLSSSRLLVRLRTTAAAESPSATNRSSRHPSPRTPAALLRRSSTCRWGCNGRPIVVTYSAA